MKNQYSVFTERANDLYMFVSLYNSYMSEATDYGAGIEVTMVEVHMLTYIEEHPGVTNTELVRYWKKSKGAISQIVTKLENKGLIERTKHDKNYKEIQLFPTPAGVKLSLAHKSYDIVQVSETMDLLLQTCTSDEIDHFFKVLGKYIQMLQAE